MLTQCAQYLIFYYTFAALHPLTKITLPGLRNYPPGLPGIAWNPWNDIRWRDDIANLNISYPFGFFNGSNRFLST